MAKVYYYTDAVKSNTFKYGANDSITLVQANKYCQSNSDLQTGLPIHECAGLAAGAAICQGGKPYFAYSHEDNSCKCCTQTDALTLTTTNAKWAIYSSKAAHEYDSNNKIQWGATKYYKNL